VLADFDLVVAADGVHSVLRSALAEYFRPSLEPGTSRYIWFGTPRPFDSFTFVFRRNDAGLFQVHAYPYDGTMSTFIVECDEGTWRRAGLDQANEAESIAYCEQLFAPDVGGRPLLSNNSSWISFLTLRNRTWHHDNVALLGDAAHTAHFSIGSGTKLAMEDAIALANSLETHEGLAGALADYELERKPRVERFQDAARQSQTYFESTARYVHLEPLQFAFHLLTRSGRIDYVNLRLRDAGFVGAVDRWLAADPSHRLVAPPPAFTPFATQSLSLGNRMALSPAPTDVAAEGLIADDEARRFERAARSGAALLVTEPVAVEERGRITSGSPGLFTDKHQAAWTRVVQLVHDASAARIGIKLSHAGRRAGTRPRHRGIDVALPSAWELLAPSAVPYSPRSRAPASMNREDMDRTRDEFTAGARRAERIGFDVLVLDMAHGYLLGSFISPVGNYREDGFGGAFENRARWPLEVFDAVRAVWPPDRLLGVAITAEDWASGGAGIEEAVLLAGLLKNRGCDYIEVRAGQSSHDWRPRYDPYFLISYSDRIRNQIGVPTMATGAIASVDQTNTIVAGGRADLCLLLT
jgi:anthraniloyl-CoA monooxygenase